MIDHKEYIHGNFVGALRSDQDENQLVFLFYYFYCNKIHCIQLLLVKFVSGIPFCSVLCYC